MALYPRGLLATLRDRLRIWPITVLTGARQTGKTTLVRDLLPQTGESKPIYYSLDDPDERLRLAADSVRRLDHGHELVILDEVQKQPGLLDAVKFLVDTDKARRFLLLGSSQILLLQKIRETLAGRATLLSLWPLALVERIEGTKVPKSGLDIIWQHGEAGVRKIAQQTFPADTARIWREKADQDLRWGGYPAMDSLGESDRLTWLRDFRATYLERDLADLGRVADLDQFALAQNLLAARTGQILSYSEVSRELGVAVNTVKRYLRFLEISFQAFLLRPLQPTVTARLVKSPKLYWTDPGLARLLSERVSLNDGAIFETFVLDQLLRWSSWQPDPPHFHFYRTHAGREVDFVVHTAKNLLGIEVKAGRQVHAGDARPLVELIETTRVPGVAQYAGRLGLVVFRGREIKQLLPHIWAIPDWQLFGPAS